MKIIIAALMLLIPQFGLAQNIFVPSGSTVENLNDGKSEKTISDKSFALTASGPLLIKTANGLPVVFFAANSSNSTIDIKNINLKSHFQELLNEDVNLIINEVTDVHVEVQGLLQKRNLVQALNRIKDLQNKYPGLALGYFLEGTAQYLLGNKDLAVKSLEQGLLIYPKDENAKKLLTNLKGGSR